jgi:hypothetical protein
MHNYCILMLVSGSTAAKQPQWFVSRIPQLVLLARGYGNGIPNGYLARLIPNPYAPLTLRNEINFLCVNMIMLLCAAADRQARLRQTLIADAGIPVSQQFPNLRTILGDKGWRLAQILQFHRLIWIITSRPIKSKDVLYRVLDSRQ